jgi:conserved hypothetical protein
MPYPIPEHQQAPHQPHLEENSTAEDCTYRSIEVEAEQTQGLPGEYLSAYSAKTDKLYVTGIFNITPEHGSTVATIARVNPHTLEIEATAKMPVASEVHPNLAGQYQFRGAFGIDVDDEHGTLWVTDASSYCVSVYRQDTLENGTLKPLWTSYDPAKGLFEQDIMHPREVYVDTKIGKAFVTGMGGLWVIDTSTYEVQKINPTPGRLTHPLTFGYDRLTRRLYATDYYLDTVYEIDPVANTVVRTLHVPAGDIPHFTRVKVHAVGVNNSLSEIYVSTQGFEGKNAGIQVLDQGTGEFKRFIRYGVNPTDMVVDGSRDLIYLGDFGTVHATEPSGGTVAVIDARSGAMLGQVQVSSARINHLTLLPNGSVMVLDKAGDYPNVTVDFHIDALTGEFSSANEDVHSDVSVPIHADALTKITVHDTGSQPGHMESRSAGILFMMASSEDGSTLGAPSTVVPGESVELSGVGWSAGEKKHPDVPLYFPGLKVPAQIIVKFDGEHVAEFTGKQLALDTYFVMEAHIPQNWRPGEEHTITVESEATDSTLAQSATVTVQVVKSHDNPQMQYCVPPASTETIPAQVPFVGYPPVGGGVSERVGD